MAKLLVFLKIALANVMVIVVLLFVAEFGARVVKFSLSCFGRCNSKYLGNPPQQGRTVDSTPLLTEYDPYLGFSPLPNLNFSVDTQGFGQWKAGSTISTDENGFRKNENDTETFSTEAPQVIVVGDSFVHGSQVGNAETWPSCLERNTGLIVRNAGVPEYGSAQALRKLESILETGDFQTPIVILQTLVGDDFGRDQQSITYGFPGPAVVETDDGELAFAPVPPMEEKGTVFHNPTLNWFDHVALFVMDHSWILQTTHADRLVRRLNELYALTVLTPPNAAEVDQIIKWTFERFDQIALPKLVVLQYWEQAESPRTIHERRIMIEALLELDIPFVDTYAGIFESPDDYRDLYNLHHNAQGNTLVCELVAEGLTQLEY